MKDMWKYLVGIAIGVGGYALYDKYDARMMQLLKNNFNKMSKTVNDSLDNMM